MSDQYAFDVFLSYSAQDREVVHAIAERLLASGVRVWLDAWKIKVGDSIPAKIEEGLEKSRVLVLCMSAHAFGAHWPLLESGTFRFRDPLNKERRFIPLRLDDAEIKGSLSQFLYIDWRPGRRKDALERLVAACRAPIEAEPIQQPVAVRRKATASVELKGQHFVLSCAFDQARGRVLTGSGDKDYHLGLWDLKGGRLVHMLKGHHGQVHQVRISPEGNRALSISSDETIRCWDLSTGECLRAFEGTGGEDLEWLKDGNRAVFALGGMVGMLWLDSGRVTPICGESSMAPTRSLASSPDERSLLTGHHDGRVRIWDLKTGRCSRILEGHTLSVNTVLWSRNRNVVLSASYDDTVRLWNASSGRCLRILRGKKSRQWRRSLLERVRGSRNVRSMMLNRDENRLLCATNAHTVEVWDVDTGQCLRVLDGHKDPVVGAAWSQDGLTATSIDAKGEIRTWDLSDLSGPSAALQPASPSLAPPTLQQSRYTNAKVLLVGEQGVGKSGLSNYLANGIKVSSDAPLVSTDAVWATHWPLPHNDKKDGVDREIWLWDFAGQVDYRLVHQLFMDDTAAAVVVFNPQSMNPFDGLGQWDRELQRATRKSFAKLLVAGRIDRGGLIASNDRMTQFMTERGFRQPLHLTSALTGAGCDELRQAIIDAIDWKQIPQTTSPTLYHRMKQEILALRDTGLVLIRLADLNQRLEMILRGEEFELQELQAAIDLLAGPGMIRRLGFGGFILLRPELLGRYGAALVRKVRQHPHEIGCIREDELLAGDLDYQDFKRLPREDEEVVLRALLEEVTSQAWCLRQSVDGTTMLTFPSYFRRERREQQGHPQVLVSYRFAGPTDEIYATLVVRLHNTVAFESAALWRDAADFKTQTGEALGFMLVRESEGTSRLDVYFDPTVDLTSRVLFLRYIHSHLAQQAREVTRLRYYTCGNQKCDARGEPFKDHAAIDKARAPGGKGKVFCPSCGKPIPLIDAIEKRFQSPEIAAQVRGLQNESTQITDNESRELMAVHHTGYIVAEAGQIYRGYTNSDHGIDGEIEFKDDAGRATGVRLYVQIKSGDSYLRRQVDETEVFRITKSRWADYWQRQAYTVMLVVRTSDGQIRWMDISTRLKEASGAGKKTVKQLVFDGEPLDAASVHSWRRRLLSGGSRGGD